MTRRLLHLSDPHFGALDQAVCAALLRLAWQLEPQVIVCSGDLTQRARPEQFRAAARFLERLPAVPRLVVPGNHDLPMLQRWLPWCDAWAAYRTHIGAEREPCLSLWPWHLAGLDTTRRWRHQRGAISAQQVERIGRYLRTAPGGAWPVVIGHHPLAVSSRADAIERPWSHRAALAEWSRVPGTTVLGGHLHEPMVLRVVPDLQHPQQGVWVMLAGTSASVRRVNGFANSVLVLEQDGDAAIGMQRHVTRWEFDAVERRFVATGVQHIGQAGMPASPPQPCPHDRQTVRAA